MSRPPSILVTRMDPDNNFLRKRYRKERDADKVRRLNVIRLMRKLKNAKSVADLLEIDVDTVRRYIEAFNAEGLYQKKDPEEAPS